MQQVGVLFTEEVNRQPDLAAKAWLLGRRLTARWETS
jgi:hypothetical protein